MWHKVIGTHLKRNLMNYPQPNVILQPRNPMPKPPIAAVTTRKPNTQTTQDMN